MYKVGDKVERVIAGRLFMMMTVTKVEGDTVWCGDWEFDAKSGMEVDPDLGWGPAYNVTGSIIRRKDHGREDSEDGVAVRQGA